MAIKWTNYGDAKFWGFFRLILNTIELYAGEPQNPDHMLAEGQALNTEREDANKGVYSKYLARAGFGVDEKTAFKALLDCISPLKKLAYVLAGKDGLRMLAIPTRMPCTREKARAVARAMLSAWADHSADPEFASLGFLFDRLQVADDAHLAAWNAKEDARCAYHDKIRSYRAIRVRGNKYIGNVKRYIGVYYDAYEDSWVKYGFEPRKKRGENKEEIVES